MVSFLSIPWCSFCVVTEVINRSHQKLEDNKCRRFRPNGDLLVVFVLRKHRFEVIRLLCLFVVVKSKPPVDPLFINSEDATEIGFVGSFFNKHISCVRDITKNVSLGGKCSKTLANANFSLDPASWILVSSSIQMNEKHFYPKRFSFLLTGMK